MSIREDLKAYIDGELPLERMEEIRKALDSDPTLKAEYDFLVALGEEIKETAYEPEVVGLEATLARVRAPKRSIWSSLALRTSFGVAAGLVLMIACSYFLISVVGGKKSEESSDSVVMRTETKSSAPAPSDESKKLAYGGDSKAESSPKSEEVNASNSYRWTKDGTAIKEHAGTDSKQKETGSTYWANPTEATQSGGGFIKSRSGIPKSEGTVSKPGFAPDSLQTGRPKEPKADEASPQPIKARVVLRVESIPTARERARQIARNLNGKLDESNPSSIKIVVPVAKFDAAVKDIHRLGDVVQSSSSGDDIPKRLQDHESRLYGLISKEAQVQSELKSNPRNRTLSKELLMNVREQKAEVHKEVNRLKQAHPTASIYVVLDEKTKQAPAVPDSATKGPESPKRSPGTSVVIVVIALILGGLTYWWLTRKN